MPTEREMPRYRCHKEVYALKIAEVQHDRANAACIIVPADDGFAPFHLDRAYLSKHSPQAGGYYIVYADGYKSFSPAKAFEEGYSLMNGNVGGAGQGMRIPD